MSDSGLRKRSIGPCTGLPDLSLLSQAELRAAEPLLVSLSLIGLDLGESRSEALVRHYVRLGNAPELIEPTEREVPALVTDLDPTVGVRVDPA